MSDARVAEAQWMRLSNWAVLHYVARTLRAFVSNLFAMVPALYGLLQIDDQRLLISAVLGAVSLVILFAVATHLCFSYRIPGDEIQLRQGVVFKKQLNLAVARIQNITFAHPFYFRPLGLVTVKIEGAGSAGEEVFLSALEVEEARALREELLARKAAVLGRDAGAAVNEVPEPTVDGTLLITRGLGSLVLHGLTNNRAWIILGGAGAAFGQLSKVLEAKLAERGIDVSGFLQDQTVGVLVLLAVSAFFTAVAIVAALSVLGSIVSYCGYELYGSEESLTLRRGLLTKHEIHMQKSRVQNVTYQQDWLDRVLGRVNLVLEQIWDQGPGGTTPGEKVLVPTIMPAEANALADTVLVAPNPRDLTYTRSNVRYFWKMAAVWTAVWGFPFGLVLAVLPAWVAAYPLMMWGVHLLVLNLSWRARGIAMTQDITVVRSGIIGIDYVVLPTFKIQDVRTVQSRLMEAPDLVTLQFRTASRTVTMPFIEGSVARRAVDLSLWRLETDERSWM